MIGGMDESHKNKKSLEGRPEGIKTINALKIVFFDKRLLWSKYSNSSIPAA